MATQRADIDRTVGRSGVELRDGNAPGALAETGSGWPAAHAASTTNATANFMIPPPRHMPPAHLRCAKSCAIETVALARRRPARQRHPEMQSHLAEDL